MVGGRYLRNGGTKNVCRNSYCLQRNLRGALQFCQKQANFIAHCVVVCLHCWLLPLSLFIVVSRCPLSSFVLFVHCLCCLSSLFFAAFVIFCCHCLSLLLFVVVVGLCCCCCWLLSVVIVSCRRSLLLLFIIFIVRCLCCLSLSS